MQANYSTATQRSLDAINDAESVCVPIICAVGILGNLLNLVVLSRIRHRRSVSSKQDKLVVRVGLSSLAVADMLVCICILPRTMVAANHVFFERWNFGLLYQLYGTALVSTFSHTSTLLLVLMAAMRYLAICHPLRSLGLSIDRAFYGLLASVPPLALLINLPVFWIHQVGEHHINGSKMLFIDIGPFSDHSRKGIVMAWVRALLGLWLPIALLVFFNVHLVQALRGSQRMQRQHVSGTSANRSSVGCQRLTATLVAVVVAFVVLVVPSEMLNALVHLTHSVPKSVPLIIFRSATGLMQVSNFAFNFILYSSVNGQFRKALRGLFCTDTAPATAPNSNGATCKSDLKPLWTRNIPSTAITVV